MDFQIEYALAGLLVGILVGLTGMGGGSLMAPLLILVFKVQPVVAVGTDLVYMSVTKLVGAWQHHRQGNVDYRLAARLAAGSIPGALVGVILLSTLPGPISGDAVVTKLLAGVMVLVGVSLLVFRRFRSAPLEATGATGATGVDLSRHKYLVPLLGAVVGLLVAMTSVGSGSLFLVLMVALYALPMRRIVGTDIVHGFVLVSVAGLAHIGAGNVDFGLAAALLIGSVPGVMIGSKLTAVLNERKLGTAVALALLAVGVKLFI